MLKMFVSDGTVLSVKYGDGGIWRIVPVHKGKAEYKKEEATADENDNNYSDMVHLTGDITWVGFGTQMRSKK